MGYPNPWNCIGYLSGECYSAYADYDCFLGLFTRSNYRYNHQPSFIRFYDSTTFQTKFTEKLFLASYFYLRSNWVYHSYLCGLDFNNINILCKDITWLNYTLMIASSSMCYLLLYIIHSSQNLRYLSDRID